jgi:hypothetical protein
MDKRNTRLAAGFTLQELERLLQEQSELRSANSRRERRLPCAPAGMRAAELHALVLPSPRHRPLVDRASLRPAAPHGPCRGLGPAGAAAAGGQQAHAQEQQGGGCRAGKTALQAQPARLCLRWSECRLQRPPQCVCRDGAGPERAPLPCRRHSSWLSSSRRTAEPSGARAQRLPQPTASSPVASSMRRPAYRCGRGAAGAAQAPFQPSPPPPPLCRSKLDKSRQAEKEHFQKLLQLQDAYQELRRDYEAHRKAVLPAPAPAPLPAANGGAQDASAALDLCTWCGAARPVQCPHRQGCFGCLGLQRCMCCTCRLGPAASGLGLRGTGWLGRTGCSGRSWNWVPGPPCWAGCCPALQVSP